jgi:RNA polymerase sigma-B factor
VTSPPRGGGAAPKEGVQRHPLGAQSAERQETRELLRAYRENHDPATRDRLVELNSDLVHFIARRFANRGEPLEDIEQVGFLGLINAIERFDPTLGNEFSTFATPTIAGEIRRYFRDKSWAVRVPRRLQENHQKVVGAQQQLSNQLGRQPSIAEIAQHLDLDVEDVLEALEVAPARHSISFDTPAGGDDEGGASLGDFLGQEDDDLQRVEMRQLVEQAMQHLTPRERQIMALRFIEELPQTEVAERLGISQMHVSRLQRAAMEQMRKELPDAAAAVAAD